MFSIFKLATAFIPDEKGELITLDQPALEMPNINDLPSTDYGLAFTKMFITLIALALLFGFTVWFLRRLVRHRLEKGTGMQAIRVLDKKMISAKTMLYVLEIEGEKILIAESQLEVKQLHIEHKQTQELKN